MQNQLLVLLKLGAGVLGALAWNAQSAFLAALTIVALWTIVIIYETEDRERRRQAARARRRPQQTTS